MKNNRWNLIAGCLFLLAGILYIIAAVFYENTVSKILMAIGGTLQAAGGVGMLLTYCRRKNEESQSGEVQK